MGIIRSVGLNSPLYNQSHLTEAKSTVSVPVLLMSKMNRTKFFFFQTIGISEVLYCISFCVASFIEMIFVMYHKMLIQV